MSKKDTMVQLRARADEVRAAFGDNLPGLVTVLRRLADRMDYHRAWDELAALIIGQVPSETGLPGAFFKSTRATAVADPVEEEIDWAAVAAEARALLATLDVLSETLPTSEEILAAAKSRLLGEPSLTHGELRSRGGDPTAKGLLRLFRPDGVEVLPAFQFDPVGEPRPVVLKINRILDADRDRWAVADWWLSFSARLGTRPATLLGGHSDDRLLAAAKSVRGKI